ncbi:YkuS family protein [Abyssisolibacter fermentans]|uniref:YkuS family protein n=1 Tax=Abyssisolibacter fermentans TaxID=1766203 RepID=UPI000829EF43|nr:YkuS family protein [Abyssisolibacter fermentans]
MTQKILIQNGLDEIKLSLEKIGYDIVTTDLNERYDVFIYKADGYDIDYYNQITSLTNDNNENVLLVNAKGKTIQEIDYIIKHKTYSSLF